MRVNAGLEHGLQFKVHISSLFLLFVLSPALLFGQASNTAGTTIGLSAFGGLTTTRTGLGDGRNTSLTAAVDLGLHQHYGLVPSAELRGTFPIGDGQTVGEKTFAAGLRIDKQLNNFQPYVDLLFGHGQLIYQNGGSYVPNTNVVYTRSATNFISPGMGIIFRTTSNFSIRADVQLQYLGTPVTPSRHITSIPVTLGIVYHLPSTTHGHAYP